MNVIIALHAYLHIKHDTKTAIKKITGLVHHCQMRSSAQESDNANGPTGTTFTNIVPYSL